jgi:hypothetical protein
MNLADVVGTLLGFVFTLFIFSYILGDNPLFRLAIYIFIGVAAGYAAAVAWYNVVWPQLLVPLWVGDRSERLFVIFPLLLSGLMFSKLSPRLAGLGNPVMAYLVGVGVATAIGGAVLGTILPQAATSVNLFDLQRIQQTGNNLMFQLVNATIILVGTLTTLIYFHFGVRSRPEQSDPALPVQRPAFVEGLARIGQVFIAITFGSLFAGVYAAALAALVERLSFLVNVLRPLFPPG